MRFVYSDKITIGLELTYSEMDKLRTGLQAELNYLFSCADCPAELIEVYFALFIDFNALCRKAGAGNMTDDYVRDIRTKLENRKRI